MPKPPDLPELPLWQPYIEQTRETTKQRAFYRDLDREIITVIDQFGVTQFPLSELPPAMLKYGMLEGLIRLMQDKGDHHTLWRGWKHGTIPVVKKPGPKPQPKLSTGRKRTLGLIRKAIVLSLRDQPHCIASISEIEDYVAGLDTDEVEAWRNEPDVRMHMRSLRNEPVLKSAAAVDDLNAAIEKAAKTPP